jgi:hypothetical protein
VFFFTDLFTFPQRFATTLDGGGHFKRYKNVMAIDIAEGVINYYQYI